MRGRGVRLDVVVDEGGVIGDGILPGVSAPVAMVGIAEKGFVSIELATRVPGGHSSLPPPQSAIGILSAAIARLESRPMPARLEKPTRELFERLGPQLPLARRAAFANLWLTRPFVMGALESSPGTNAMVRTTAAPTIFQAGTKDNVLPSEARAVVNFRVLPGDSVASVVDHVRSAIGDARVEVRPAGRFSAEPSAISSTDSDAFRSLERSIRSAAPTTIVAPFQVVVVTDARHFADMASDVFRFLPVRLAPTSPGCTAPTSASPSATTSSPSPSIASSS
jgi:carboxypeptidase PM20D1